MPVTVQRDLPELAQPANEAPRYRTTNSRGACDWRIDEARVQGVANAEALLDGAQLVILFDARRRVLRHIGDGRFAAANERATFELDMGYARDTMRVFLVTPAAPDLPAAGLTATVVLATRCHPGRVM